MKIEEAISKLKESLSYICREECKCKEGDSSACYFFCNDRKAINIAIKALEKQIPKPPKKTDHWKMCPVCYEKYGFSYDILVGMVGDKTKECHCSNCGQLIKMETENDKL